MIGVTGAGIALLFAVATALPVLLLWQVLRLRRDSPTARAFAVTLGALAVWSGTSLLQLFVTDTAQFVLTVLAFVGIVTVPVALLVFTLHYTDRERFVTPETVALLSVIPAVTLVVVATNPLHGLFYTSVESVRVGSLTTLAVEYGPWFAVHTVYSYSLLAVSSALLVVFGATRRRLYRTQAASLVLGVLVAWGANIAYLLGLTPFPAVDLTPVGLAAGVALLGIAVFRARLIDVTPVARDAVVTVLDDGVVVVEDGRVVDANPAARALLRTDAPIGERAEDTLPETVVETVRDGVQTTDGGDDIVDLVRDGERRWYRIRAIPLDRRGGTQESRTRISLSGAIGADGDTPPATVLLLTDVTDRRHHLRRLRKQNEQLEEFAAAAAHDLRNPLNVIDGYTDLARESGEPEHFDRIEEATDRMDQLVEDLLALGRRGRLVESTSDVSLAEIAERAWQSIDTTDATLEIKPGDPVSADADRLVQLLENLFANAVQQDPAATVTVGRTTDGFYVADDGPGIPPDERERVFDYGYTTRESGSGFGLAIVETVADAHGWEVTVTESGDGGARFEVTGITRPDTATRPVIAG